MKFMLIGTPIQNFTTIRKKRNGLVTDILTADGRTDRYGLQIRSYLLRKESRINQHYIQIFSSYPTHDSLLPL